MVFYFPQGHIEQINAFVEDRDDPTLPTYDLPSKVLFKVLDVTLKATPDYDEVFAEFVLVPVSECEGSKTARSDPQTIPENGFQKILTMSDARAHGGCVLPKSGVEKTLPPLDVRQEQALQKLVASDLNGASWDFEHVYHGNPRRHSLVGGWNDFADAKKLKTGDTCIFMRGVGLDKIYVGVKRAVTMHRESADLTGNNMRRGVLLDASNAMRTRSQFRVIYYPRMCSRFIVPYDVVMEAQGINYLPGMGVEMFGTGEGDPNHIPRKFSGMITTRDDSDPAKWQNSEWRCLQIKWNASSSTQVLPPRVSPWEVQPLALEAPQMQSPMPIELVIRNKPFSRTNENNRSVGMQSRGFPGSVFEVGSSSRQNEENMDEDN